MFTPGPANAFSFCCWLCFATLDCLTNTLGLSLPSVSGLEAGTTIARATCCAAICLIRGAGEAPDVSMGLSLGFAMVLEDLSGLSCFFRNELLRGCGCILSISTMLRIISSFARPRPPMPRPNPAPTMASWDWVRVRARVRAACTAADLSVRDRDLELARAGVNCESVVRVVPNERPDRDFESTGEVIADPVMTEKSEVGFDTPTVDDLLCRVTSGGC